MDRPKNEEGRAEVQRAATELFLEQGYAATPYADIARATNRPRATMQGLFPKKSQLAMGGSYEVVYQRLSSGAPIGTPALVDEIIVAFVAYSGIEHLRPGKADAPEPLGAEALDDARAYLRDYITQ